MSNLYYTKFRMVIGNINYYIGNKSQTQLSVKDNSFGILSFLLFQTKNQWDAIRIHRCSALHTNPPGYGYLYI